MDLPPLSARICLQHSAMGDKTVSGTGTVEDAAGRRGSPDESLRRVVRISPLFLNKGDDGSHNQRYLPGRPAAKATREAKQREWHLSLLRSLPLLLRGGERQFCRSWTVGSIRSSRRGLSAGNEEPTRSPAGLQQPWLPGTQTGRDYSSEAAVVGPSVGTTAGGRGLQAKVPAWVRTVTEGQVFATGGLQQRKGAAGGGTTKRQFPVPPPEVRKRRTISLVRVGTGTGAAPAPQELQQQASCRSSVTTDGGAGPALPSTARVRRGRVTPSGDRSPTRPRSHPRQCLRVGATLPFRTHTFQGRRDPAKGCFSHTRDSGASPPTTSDHLRR